MEITYQIKHEENEFFEMVAYLRQQFQKRRGLMKRFEAEPAYENKDNLPSLSKILLGTDS